MKSAIILCLSLVLMGTAFAQAPPKPSATVPAMQAFWEKFKAAVARNDKEAVAALSRFPISMPYGVPDVKNKTQLMRRYRLIFFGEANAAKCFPKAKPFVDQDRPKEFLISCGFAAGGGQDEPLVYTFALTRNGWRFAGFDNINE